MKRTSYKTTFGLSKRIFVELLTGIVNGPNHTKCVLLSKSLRIQMFNLPLLIYILMNTVKNPTTKFYYIFR